MRQTLFDALRDLARDVRFTLLALALLSVTIGATTAVYAVVQAVVLRPLPFADQERLVVIWQRDLRREQPLIEVAYGEMVDWRARTPAFEDLAVVGSVNWSLTLAGRNEDQAVPLAAVSSSFFTVAGTAPLLGRGFEDADESGAAPRVMVISHGLWMRRYAGDAEIVGRTVPVKYEAAGPPVPIQVVGVMPEGFDYPRRADVWLPAAPLIRKHGETHGGVESALGWLRVFFVVGRVRSGVPLDRAARDLTQVVRSADTKGGPEPPSEVVVTPMARYLLGPAGPVLWTLLGGSALMLLIACANVAGLQVSRSIRRRHALAIRLAMGASHRHLVRGTLAESALLTAASLAGAVIVAHVIARTLMRLAPTDVPRLDTVALLDPSVLAFGLAAAFLTLVLSGLWPALVAARLEAVSVLAHGASAAADPGSRRVQRLVVVTQLALALVLLAGTALFLRSLAALDRTTLGFDPDGLVALNVSARSDDPDRWNGFYDALIARVETLPGIGAAAGVALRPLSGPVGWDNQPIYPGQVPEDPSTWGLNPHTNTEVVTPGYFRTMGIRLLRGRVFSPADTLGSPGVVVVGESAARRLWPGREALGQRLRDPSYRSGGDTHAAGWQTVVGVVEDVRYRGLTDVRLDLYLPATQSTNRVYQLMVRTTGTASDAVAPVRAAARAVDPGATVSDATIMSEVVAAESAPWRFLMRVFVSFATLAAVLAAIGLGAVITLAVAARRRELAIRAALGAGRARLRAVVLGEGLWLVLAGTALGLGGAMALGRGAASVLVGVAPHDPLALGAAAAVAAGIGVLATWLPARRASDADPIEALRTL
jgi:predicted permease